MPLPSRCKFDYTYRRRHFLDVFFDLINTSRLIDTTARRGSRTKRVSPDWRCTNDLRSHWLGARVVTLQVQVLGAANAKVDLVSERRRVPHGSKPWHRTRS